MGPMLRAYAALAAELETALIGAGLLTHPGQLAIDPPDSILEEGEPDGVLAAAALVEVETLPVRTVMGGPGPRYVVERTVRLSASVASPEKDWRDGVAARVAEAVATLQVRKPTLDDAAERLMLTDATPEDLPPNGVSCLFTFVLRVRSGDPLGLTD